MKGILLAGGTGSRLYPVTQVVSKHLLPVYNKPMIYYPLSMLMLAGIKDILLITNPQYLDSYESLLGDGSRFGISISYKAQDSPRGIADAFVLGRDFIGLDSVCLVLGDNIFHGHHIPQILQKARNRIEDSNGAMIFGHSVSNPCDYGVIEIDARGDVLSIEEKPQDPKSNYAAVGLYMYDNDVLEYVKHLTPSARGELEITSLNQLYLDNSTLNVMVMGRGIAWFDAGNCDSLFRVSAFVQNIEKRQGLKISCLEEIAHYLGYISRKQVNEASSDIPRSEYPNYLLET
jgi:glucose-1-phosphate thymidylyltransferase